MWAGLGVCTSGYLCTLGVKHYIFHTVVWMHGTGNEGLWRKILIQGCCDLHNFIEASNAPGIYTSGNMIHPSKFETCSIELTNKQKFDTSFHVESSEWFKYLHACFRMDMHNLPSVSLSLQGCSRPLKCSDSWGKVLPSTLKMNSPWRQGFNAGQLSRHFSAEVISNVDNLS